AEAVSGKGVENGARGVEQGDRPADDRRCQAFAIRRPREGLHVIGETRLERDTELAFGRTGHENLPVVSLREVASGVTDADRGNKEDPRPGCPKPRISSAEPGKAPHPAREGDERSRGDLRACHKNESLGNWRSSSSSHYYPLITSRASAGRVPPSS